MRFPVAWGLGSLPGPVPHPVTGAHPTSPSAALGGSNSSRASASERLPHSCECLGHAGPPSPVQPSPSRPRSGHRDAAPWSPGPWTARPHALAPSCLMPGRHVSLGPCARPGRWPQPVVWTPHSTPLACVGPIHPCLQLCVLFIRVLGACPPATQVSPEGRPHPDMSWPGPR